VEPAIAEHPSYASPLLTVCVQANEYAQIVAWIGTFVIGIGLFSLSNLGEIHSAAVTHRVGAHGLPGRAISGRQNATALLGVVVSFPLLFLACGD
jgi:hypothetical protein